MNKIKLVLIIAVAFFLLQTIFFYRGIYLPPPTKMYQSEIVAPPSKTTEFLDVYEEKEGTVLFDLSHDNWYETEELNVLQTMLISRGIDIEYVRDPEDLDDGLKKARSFVVISPKEVFTSEEIRLVEGFLKKNGRVLLIGDPARKSEINSLSATFDIIFEDDYLYNLKENDGNYRYIFVEEFREGEITRNLNKIALYTAGSITSPGGGIAYTDENTFSSLREMATRFSPMVLAKDDLILAIGDITFMMEPYNNVLDNGKLIANIADYLSNSDRIYYLSDFPYYFEDLDIVYHDSSLLKTAIELKNVLRDAGKDAIMKEEEDPSRERILLGFFDNPGNVSGYLGTGGISLSGKSIKIEGVGRLSKEEIALLYLHKDAGGSALIILADREVDMEDAIELLKTGEIEDNLITEVIGTTSFVPSEEIEFPTFNLTTTNSSEGY